MEVNYNQLNLFDGQKMSSWNKFKRENLEYF